MKQFSLTLPTIPYNSRFYCRCDRTNPTRRHGIQCMLLVPRPPPPTLDRILARRRQQNLVRHTRLYEPTLPHKTHTTRAKLLPQQIPLVALGHCHGTPESTRRKRCLPLSHRPGTRTVHRGLPQGVHLQFEHRLRRVGECLFCTTRMVDDCWTGVR